MLEIFIEELEEDPSKYLPEVKESHLSETVVKVDLNKPMSEIRKLLAQYPSSSSFFILFILLIFIRY